MKRKNSKTCVAKRNNSPNANNGIKPTKVPDKKEIKQAAPPTNVAIVRSCIAYLTNRINYALCLLCQTTRFIQAHSIQPKEYFASTQYLRWGL